MSSVDSRKWAKRERNSDISDKKNKYEGEMWNCKGSDKKKVFTATNQQNKSHKETKIIKKQTTFSAKILGKSQKIN